VPASFLSAFASIPMRTGQEMLEQTGFVAVNLAGGEGEARCHHLVEGGR
jgi:hypothetical protein